MDKLVSADKNTLGLWGRVKFETSALFRARHYFEVSRGVIDTILKNPADAAAITDTERREALQGILSAQVELFRKFSYPRIKNEKDFEFKITRLGANLICAQSRLLKVDPPLDILILSSQGQEYSNKDLIEMAGQLKEMDMSVITIRGTVPICRLSSFMARSFILVHESGQAPLEKSAVQNLTTYVDLIRKQLK